jgi:uncharacterized protein YggT (Ycf19 family)
VPPRRSRFMPPTNACRHMDSIGRRARRVLVQQPADDAIELPDGGFTMSVRDERPIHTLAVTRGGVGFAAVVPAGNAAGVVVTSGIASTLSLYQSALIVRLILTWFPNPPQVIANPLATICDPYLNIFRGIIPPLGGIDLSPILAFVALDLLANSASSLSAELPPEHQTQKQKAAKKSKFGNGRPAPQGSKAAGGAQ